MKVNTIPAQVLGLAWLLFAPVRSTAQGQWPMVLDTAGYITTVYTPQPESYKDGRFTARAAVSVKMPDDKGPVFGAIWASGFLEVDRTTRMGVLRQFAVTDVRFPSVQDTAKVRRLKEYLTAEIPRHTAPVSIDLIVAALESEVRQDAEYQNTPPEIIYSEKRSLLLSIDGEPIFDAVPNSPYQRVLNSPLVLVKASSGPLYLYASPNWLTASDVKGPYQLATDVPRDLLRVSQKVDSTARANGTYVEPDGKVPEVLVRNAPAELLQTDGPADMKPIQGTELLSASNAATPIFMDIASQRYFVLLSGRWFSAADLAKGPWTHVKGSDLPADFSRIPEGTKDDEVLASVPGTQASVEAARDALIPQTAAVDRGNVTLKVTYKGDPQWQKVDGTTMSYAINASTTVLQLDGLYHVCDDAVWYDGPTPNGPWAVSTSAPRSVKDIAPSSPVYNVKYVEVYDSTPDVVYVGYTPGYTGSYIYGGTVIYGTGWYYPPPPPIYYYPRPVTYGFSVHYNPWTGWGVGMSYNAGWYQFSTYGGWGACYHCGGWWGPPVYYPPPYRYRPVGGYYGHRPTYVSGNTVNINRNTNINVGGGNLYNRVDRPGVRPSRPMGSGAGRPPMRPADGSARPGAGGRDVYADPKGNVYRGAGQGTQQFSSGRWDGLPKDRGGYDVGRSGLPARPDARPAQPMSRPSSGDPYRMQQDRARGMQRMNNFDHYQSRPAMPRGGGGMGGGGGMPARSMGGRMR